MEFLQQVNQLMMCSILEPFLGAGVVSVISFDKYHNSFLKLVRLFSRSLVGVVSSTELLSGLVKNKYDSTTKVKEVATKQFKQVRNEATDRAFKNDFNDFNSV